MKKSTFFIVPALTLLNAALIGLTLESAIKLFWLFGVGIFLKFALTCAAFFIIAMLGIVSLAILNSKLNKKVSLTKRAVCVQYILSLILAIPTMYAWEMLFDFIFSSIYQF